MKIKILEDQDISAFNKLALSYGSIFNTVQWTDLFSVCLTRYGIYNNGDVLTGGFIIYRESKFGLSVYRNPPYTADVGVFLKVDAVNPVSAMDVWKKALSLVAQFLDNLPYSVLSISLNREIIDMQPFIWRKYKVVPGYTYVITLASSLEDIHKRMSSERRNDIKKAQKDGLVVRKLDNYQLVKSLVLKTFYRQDIKVQEKYLDKILFIFANADNSFAFATFQNDIPISCSFFVYDRKSAYYLFGGYDPDNKHHGAGALAIWEAVKFSVEKGLIYFDFEGSMIPHIEKYFRGFGGVLTPYYRINKAKLPYEFILKLFQRELF